MRLRPSPIAVLVSIVLIIGLVTPVGAEPISPAAEAAPASEGALAAGQVQLLHIDNGLVSPLGIANAQDQTNRLFVLEQRGTVKIVKNGNVQGGFFLDLRSGVPGGIKSGGERGLLGLAFHPNFDSNRYLFVYYTRSDGDIIIAKLRANSSRTSVPLSSYERVLRIEHSSASNHNGGQLLFGPDGYLYIFTGDGGGGGDPFENSQNKNSLLGKTLRVAPNLNGGPPSTPSSNPYDGPTAGRDEIWAIGLRNPWRASFDRETDGLWIADVGQGSWEEINRVGLGAAGRNYGWDCREGFQPYESTGCSGLTFQKPLAAYGHSGGNCSVTGGYVYRGQAYEDLQGWYVLGDFCSGRLWTVSAAANSPAPLKFHRDTSAMISSFGESENGELYMTDYAGGHLYRVIAP